MVASSNCATKLSPRLGAGDLSRLRNEEGAHKITAIIIKEISKKSWTGYL